MSTVLLIGIGNTARGDDGVGHEVAAILLGSPLASNVRIITAMGLDIAMAADVAETDLLIVVDAARRTEPAVEVTVITPAPSSSPTGHGVDAPGLLSLTESLYGRIPRALLISVAAPVMEHGEGLSALAREAAREAASRALGLLG